MNALKKTCVYHVGQTTLPPLPNGTLLQSEKKPVEDTSQGPKIFIFNQNEMMEFPLDADHFVIRFGKSEAPNEVDIVLEGDDGISDIQVVMVKFAEGWMLLDCGLRNKLKVNGIETNQQLM